MQDSSFFNKPTEQSKVKTRIVEKYFDAWAKIIIPHAKNWNSNIGYVDLYAGPGKYENGSKSTPVLVLEKAIENEDMLNLLVSVFNDINSTYIQSLKSVIDSIPDIELLTNRPSYSNTEVGKGWTQILEHVKGIPTLFFVDPWGYKGLSLELISSALKNWGCDCIFFFNYNRINMGINNPFVEEYMDALFGTESAKKLRTKIVAMSPSERETAIVEKISKSLKSKGGEYVQSFRFKNTDNERSSHYLIFVSKDQTGHKIMKEIMAGESTYSPYGVPSFEYDSLSNEQIPLFDPLDELAELLLTEFADRAMTMKQIFDEHNVGTPYISKNYKDVLKKLENEGKVQTNPPADKRPKDTFGDEVIVTFPPKSQ